MALSNNALHMEVRMRKLCVLWLVLVAWSTPQAQPSRSPPAVPQSWVAFQASPDKADIRLVAQIHSMKWWDACAAWGVEARKKVVVRRHWALQEYLLDGKYINGTDLGEVRGSVPVVGMTTCGAFAVLGMPSRRNVTATGGGEHVQYVFERRRVYVYTHSATGDGNALVRSVQY